MPRIILMALATMLSLHSHAAPTGKLETDDFLECAAHYANWGYLLKTKGHDKKDELAEVEKSVQFYLQIAEALEGKPLKERFVKRGEAEMELTMPMLKPAKFDEYLSYSKNKKEKCRLLVKNNQSEVMKAMDKFYAEHGGR